MIGRGDRSAAPRSREGAGIIVFDGVCTLCNRAVDFIVRRDPAGRFRFASNQSEAGRRVLEPFGIDPGEASTLYLVEGGRVFERSTAALRIAGGLGLPWKLAAAFLLVPRFLRDLAYDVVARNRYRLFGRRETCRLPSPEERSRFLVEAEDLATAGDDPSSR